MFSAAKRKQRSPRAQDATVPAGRKMQIALEAAVGQMFLLSFEGKDQPPPELRDLMRLRSVGGVVLFRHKNMGTLAQLRQLTSALQAEASARGQPPLIIAADQEGGQLMALGEGTCFPGNMALGATGSERLSYQVGRALGKELSAVGINVDFAPVCDVNSNPRNPVIGTRSFGEDPRTVAALSQAMIRGLQRSGVAATAKHFPGHGDTASDSHHSAPVLNRTMRQLRAVELVPFRAAIAAGARLVMPSHMVLPALNAKGEALPATVSPRILRDLLRKELRYGGVIVSDALDMHALGQGIEYIAETMAAAAAGNDLLLFNHHLSRLEPAFRNLVQAAGRGLFSAKELGLSAGRILSLKRWLSRQRQFGLEVIRCPEHLKLASEVARRSVTLVRNAAGRLPLELPLGSSVAVLMPRPEDLTPADTSSYVQPGLGKALLRFHDRVHEFAMALDPADQEVRQLTERLSGYDLVIVGTIDACRYPQQARVVRNLLERGVKTIAVALRLPYDLAAYPQVETYVCGYSILPSTMEALAEALFGRIPFRGKLPVTIPRRWGLKDQGTG